MKIKVTEEKLYPVFKKFMEIYFKKYEWRKDKDGIIFFIDPEGHGHLELEKNKKLLIFHRIRENILRYIPMEQYMLQTLMSRWVEETLQVEGTHTFQKQFNAFYNVGDTFPL